jgi:arsenite methyltransferase
LFGRCVVARKLNNLNRNVMTATVDALRPATGEATADIGFDGGLGLRLLLEQVGPTGRVHGVDISTTMFSAAARRRRAEAARLPLHTGSITALPLTDSYIVYFVADADLASAELARVLRLANRVVLGIADPLAMAKLPFVPYGFRLRPVQLLTTGPAEAGLPVVEHRRVGTGEGAYHLLVAQRRAS